MKHGYECDEMKITIYVYTILMITRLNNSRKVAWEVTSRFSSFLLKKGKHYPNFYIIIYNFKKYRNIIK